MTRPSILARLDGAADQDDGGTGETGWQGIGVKGLAWCRLVANIDLIVLRPDGPSWRSVIESS